MQTIFSPQNIIKPDKHTSPKLLISYSNIIINFLPTMKATTPFKSLTLYGCANSSASWRVRIALDWKNMQYEHALINIYKGAHKEQGFEKINPMRQIPALEVDGKHLIPESLPICLFLEDTVPLRPLLPQDAVQKAQILAFCEMINSGIHPKIVMSVANRVEELGLNRADWMKYWINKGYQSLEMYLEKTRGKYCFGDNITLADAYFLPMTENGIAKFGLEIGNFPLVNELLQNLRDVPELQNSYPKNQPDFGK